MIVLDASVAAKWILAEVGSAAANELLESSIRIAAPAIVRIEVAGAVLRRWRSGELGLEHARAACERWAHLIDGGFVHLIPTDAVYAAAFDLSFRVRHPVTDCLYIAAATMLDCPLITADRGTHDRGREVYDRISLLTKAA